MDTMPERVPRTMSAKQEANMRAWAPSDDAPQGLKWLLAELDAERAALAEAERENERLRRELAYIVGKDEDAIGELSVVWVCDDWQDEYAEFYKAEHWPLGSHRAASAFIHRKVMLMQGEVATLRADLRALAAILERVALDFDVIRCDCGAPYAGCDPHLLIKEASSILARLDREGT